MRCLVSITEVQVSLDLTSDSRPRVTAVSMPQGMLLLTDQKTDFMRGPQDVRHLVVYWLTNTPLVEDDPRRKLIEDIALM